MLASLNKMMKLTRNIFSGVLEEYGASFSGSKRVELGYVRR